MIFKCSRGTKQTISSITVPVLESHALLHSENAGLHSF